MRKSNKNLHEIENQNNHINLNENEIGNLELYQKPYEKLNFVRE